MCIQPRSILDIVELPSGRRWHYEELSASFRVSIDMFLASNEFALAEEPPSSDDITAYDNAHMAIYLSLLYAAGEGHSEEKIARDILGMDPVAEPARTQRVMDSHLRRARWLAENGHHALLQS